MLRLLFLALCLLSAACAPENPGVAVAIPGNPELAATTQTEVASAPAPAPERPSAPAEAPRAFRGELGGITLSGVAFDSRSHRLVIADQAGGPGSTWADAKSAAGAFNGLAAVNGGFFTPEGAPLGLVISGGKRSGSINRASSLGAGFYEGGISPSLSRREAWTAGIGDALQSGPFLIEKGKAVGGLSDASSTARTIIGWDGGARWFLARTGTCSLASLAAALQGASPGGVRAVSVLNLDGGRSSDLWISSRVEGGPVSERPFWNKPVRNFLVLVPRS